jgi:hypothetical protein
LNRRPSVRFWLPSEKKPPFHGTPPPRHRSADCRQTCKRRTELPLMQFFPLVAYTSAVDQHCSQQDSLHITSMETRTCAVRRKMDMATIFKSITWRPSTLGNPCGRRDDARRQNNCQLRSTHECYCEMKIHVPKLEYTHVHRCSFAAHLLQTPMPLWRRHAPHRNHHGQAWSTLRFRTFEGGNVELLGYW